MKLNIFSLFEIREKITFENPKIAAKDKMAYGVQQNTNTEARVTTLRKSLDLS